jgi:hypothetical protein
MNKNVGTLDRVLRIVVGAAILCWGLLTENMIGAIGFVPLITGVFAWCPAYCPLKLSTVSCCGGSCKKE